MRINDSYFGDHMHENIFAAYCLKYYQRSVSATIGKFLLYKVMLQFLLSFMFLKPAFRFRSKTEKNKCYVLF